MILIFNKKIKIKKIWIVINKVSHKISKFLRPFPNPFAGYYIFFPSFSKPRIPEYILDLKGWIIVFPVFEKLLFALIILFCLIFGVEIEKLS